MSLRAGYRGFKKVINGLKIFRPGVLGIDLGTGLTVDASGKLNVTGDLEDYAPNIIANTKLIKDTVGWSGKNKCPRFSNYSQANVVFTVDGNGVVDITTSAAASANVWNVIDSGLPVLENGKKYKVSGLGTSTNQDGYVVGDNNGADYVYVHDDGNGGEFTYDSSKPLKKIQIGLRSGQTASHTKLSPMLCDADILDATYEPYFGSTAFPRSEQTVLGAKNWFNIDAPIVTTSQNTTDTITSSKTGSSLRVTNSVEGAEKWAYYTGFSLPQNTDIIATFGLIYTSGKAKLVVDGSTDGSNWIEIKQSNNITENGDYSLSFNTGNYTKFRARFYCTIDISETGDVTYTNIVFKLASDTDTTYAPYAMTNRELTNSAADQKTAINAIITAATGAADFDAFKTAIGAITPVTRSLSLTKESITEEVKEAEPEKTVTKKRTTKKKTEEV